MTTWDTPRERRQQRADGLTPGRRALVVVVALLVEAPVLVSALDHLAG